MAPPQTPRSPAKMKPGAIDATKSIFPLDAYAQEVDTRIPPAHGDYPTPFLDAQTQAALFNQLMARYFGRSPADKSPGNGEFIASLMGDRGEAQLNLRKFIEKFTRKNQDGKAAIAYAPVSDRMMRKASLAPTPQTMALLIKNMIGKNYGWGNLYGLKTVRRN